MENILITGASGEVGHELINKLKGKSSQLTALDLNKLDKKHFSSAKYFYKGSVTDVSLIEKVFKKHRINTVYHLAATLSTSAEKNPYLAHDVNVNGTINLLEACIKQKQKIKFIFPSSIAVYGMPYLKVKSVKAKVKESEYLNPITMYGINKLYCEQLCFYYSTHYSQLTTHHKLLDFRCLRFPGLISADTLPTGGTSDYAPEMIHAAAKRKKYDCFVRPDTKIPFMAMPDAIDALIQLTKAPKNSLSQSVYNVSGFSSSAKEIDKIVKKNFKNAKITYKVDKKRQKIVDSWPKDINDSIAKKTGDGNQNTVSKKPFLII